MADRLPIFGYRRSCYVLLGLLCSSVAVAGLPQATFAMSEGSALGQLGVLLLLLLFGIGFAMAGVSHLSLVADVVPAHRRGLQVALIWAMLLVGMIVSLAFIRAFMPVFDPERMQQLYLLTIPVVIGLTLLGLVGVEKRRRREDLAEAPTAKTVEGAESAVAAFFRFLRTAAEGRTTRSFFLFIFIALMGIGIQENILEVFGAEVLGMTVGETGRFQQLWGGGALVGMFVMGAATMRWSLPKSAIINAGVAGIAAGLALLAWAASTADAALVLTALIVFGLFNGFFLVGSLTAMMDLTTPEDRGAYMGLWGLSLALANGFASIIGGALVTGLIETGLTSARDGYAGIFLLEALLMLGSLHFIRKVDIRQFQGIRREGLTEALARDV